MKNPYSTIAQEPEGAVIRPSGEQTGCGQFEVNVIYTNPKATGAALKSAALLARDLGARIEVKAIITVPVRLPLDQPPVCVSFVEGLLEKLIRELGQFPFEPTAHLYVCRDQIETLLNVLKPNSLVIIGGRKRWWPTAETRMARVLRSEGHRVVFVPFGTGKINATCN